MVEREPIREAQGPKSQVVAPPPQVEPATQVAPSWRVREKRALKLLGSGLALLLFTLFVLHSGGVWTSLRLAWMFLVAGALLWAAVIVSVLVLRQLLLQKPPRRLGLGLLIALGQAGLGTLLTAFSVFGSVLTLVYGSNFARGRQLRRFGKLQLPPVTGGDAWASLPMQVDPDPDLRSALAAQWRENGRTEHASIAAFAKLTLDLVALGAPPKLIADAQRDALDELRHTELCFSVARALDGKAESPGPFPAARSASGGSGFGQLAVDSLVDGALHEGVSARVIAQLVKRCEDPATREVLRELAADEGRHAAHGWDVVEWCLEQGGEAVRAALLGAVQALPTSISPHLPEAARGGAWERFGIHGSALEQEEYAKAREHLVRRVRTLGPRARAA